MSKIAYNYIQIFAVIALLGYWATNAVATLLFGDTSSSVSIIYRGILLLLSLITIYICRRDLSRLSDNRFLMFYGIVLILYSIRMYIDVAIGPFVGIIPTDYFVKDVFYIIGSVFITSFALISCRNHLDMDKICQLIYWLGLVIILIIPYITELDVENMQDSEERMDAGRGLGSLALVKIGVIEIIVAIHLILNRKHKYIYILGLTLAIWTTLASGSRGGLLALIIALFYFLIVRYRKNIPILFFVFVSLYVFVVNVVPILEWLSQYFPIIGQRMLATIVKNDQSGREILREKAYELIFQNPILGYSYRLNPSETGYTCHNGILDLLIAFGIPLGLLATYFVYFRSMMLATRLMDRRECFFSSVAALWVVIASISGSGITDSTFCFAICLLGAMYNKYEVKLVK